MMSVDGSNIVRVSDEKAVVLYHEGFRYVSKSIWKEKVRDVEKEPALNKDTGETEMVSKHSNKMSKATKRQMRKSNK
jgi:hypothetical protein